jgi:hypothetical protein
VREWERTTRRCRWEELPAPLLDQCAERHGREDLAADRLACVETVSTPVKKRPFGAAKTGRTVAGVTRSYLIWSGGSGADQFVAAARLAEIEVRDYRSELRPPSA